ncbi:hypothetical protein L2E82_12168 [Cichorium intybus]|uniref:Uncharacterized protein n=1 Tax=Cichorium intybus TaxID=13427 RepID=A0ACB9GGI9_CICIN|nr:hypothetical protein L2E82_12168 [Cichorium intybus]
MVTGEEETQSPPPPPSASSQDQTTYNQDSPNAPSSSKVAPSHGKAVYGGDNLEGRPSPKGPHLAGRRYFLALLLSSYDETISGHDYLTAQPSTKGGSADGETVYG